MKIRINKLFLFFSLVLVLASAILFFVNHQETLSLDIGIARATLHDDLTPGTTNNDSKWLFSGVSAGGRSINIGVWSMLLGLANAFVALVLFFFAFVNIAHIQYDTYQIKKVLPNLLIGIVLANFSMLICRLMVDIASVLTVTFVNSPDSLGKGIMCAFRMSTNNGIGDLVTQLLTGAGLGSLIMIVLITIIMAIGIIILAMLLWIRKIVIYLLAATSPLAFIMMAFPPTEQYFKKWWDWEIKYVFMGPIMIFMLWLAAEIGKTNCTSGGFSLLVLFTVIGLVYLAAAMPFMLGGGAMALAQKVGKGVGKAAVNNPWSKRKIDRAKGWAGDRFAGTKLGMAMDAGRAADEQAIENSKGLRDAKYQQRQAEHLEKTKDKQKNIDQAIKAAKTDLENLRLQMELEVKQGNLGNVSDKFLRSINGIKDKNADAETIRKRYLDQRQKTSDMKNAMEKEESETLLLQAGVVAHENEKLKHGTNQMSKVHLRTDENGDDLAAGAPDREATYTDAMNEVTNLEFKAKEHAGTPEGAKYHKAAQHLREQTEQYRKTNEVYPPGTTIDGKTVAGEKINYDAFKDKNLAGRQMKTMGVGVADEIKTLQQTNSHTELVDATDNPSKAFTNGRFSCSSEEHDNMLTGDVGEVGINQRIVSTEYVRAQFENAKGASHGDRKGIESQAKFEDRIQAAHDRKAARLTAAGTPTAAKEIKVEKRHGAITKLSAPAQEHMKAQIMMQSDPTTYPDTAAGRTAAIAAYDAGGATRDAAVKSFDATKIDTTSSEKGASYAKAYLDGVNTEYETDDTMKMASNPGIPIRQANP